VVNAVHFDGHKGWTMVKRFKIETTKLKERYSFLTDHAKSKSAVCHHETQPAYSLHHQMKGKPMTGEVSLGDFMDVKGWKAVGNKLSDALLSSVKEVESLPGKPAAAADEPLLQGNLFGEPEPVVEHKSKTKEEGDKKTFKAGDTIEFD
jgi:topoisomerase-4 subunit A